MKTINIALVAALAVTLAGCWESGAGNTQLNDLVVEPPEMNLVSDLPAEPANPTEGSAAAPANASESAPAAAATRAEPTPAKAAPAVERRAPAPAAAPKEEAADPHAGHDMSTMNHQ